MINTTALARKSLTLGVSSAALLAALATPAFAQDAGQAQNTVPGATDNKPAPAVISSANTTGQTSTDDQAAAGDVVVTGTLFRRTDTETPSPVTVLTAANLEARGVNTIEDAVQRLSANGAGTLPTAFSPTGFAKGASAPSLRGLTTDSTLVLFDGLRAAYYPLADDGVRNFVDINAIPGSIVDRVEVLKDGASSTYGADAIGGVINIITKKQIQGLNINASAGTSQRGDGGERRITATAGYGDLQEQGFNFYVSGEYQKDDPIFARDRGYPYNTSDLSSLCGTSVGNASGTIAAGSLTCRTNSVVNGIQYNGLFAGIGATTVPFVRPGNAAGTAAIAGSRYQILNPALGCGNLPSIQLTTLQQTNSTVNGYTNTGATAPLGTLCQQDLRNQYFTIQPLQERIGGSARGTVNLGSHAQAYALFNFYEDKVFYTAAPASVTVGTAPGGPQYTPAQLALPVYVCPRGTTVACTAANGTLNPNNPFAGLGQTALILYRFADLPFTQRTKADTYRVATGVSGSFMGDYNYTADFTYMRQNLIQSYTGVPYIQNVLNVIADGSYNFLNPALNSQATRDYIAPRIDNRSYSTMLEAQANISKALFTLPGGPLQIGVGGAYRREAVNAPSANPVTGVATQGYSGLNRFGTSGSRSVYSAFFEAGAPVFDQLELNASGRYDHYSTGQSNFSPKFGVKFKPIRQFAIRGTYSRGFRIPSFAESYSDPTTGFVPTAVPATTPGGAAFIAAHGGDSYATAGYSYGLTSTGNPNLQPEKARNITAGVIIEPKAGISLSVDYYNIRKTNLITPPDYSQVENLYYANNGVVNLPGLTIVPGVADPLYPNALPLLGYIQYTYINADSLLSSGIDFDLEISRHITPSLKLTSSFEGTYVIELSQTIGGVKQRYDDTLGPDNVTSASGTPKFRASWQNTFEFDRYSLSGTVYYTSGYGQEAEDIGGIRGQCTGASLTHAVAVYRDNVTPVLCRVKRFINVDMTASVKVNERFSLYANVLNLLDVSPPYDPATYGGGSGVNRGNYNPAWAQEGIVGRYFRFGAKAKF